VSDDAAWLDTRTSGAPRALLARVHEWLRDAPDVPTHVQLAEAGEQALRAAIRSGAGREAALDLLAADALITLALLESAERDPAGLAIAARSLRVQATVTP
jgi:hypothetical protein